MNMISIKEAGRYANFLDRMISGISMLPYGDIQSKLIEVEEFHKKGDSYKEAENITLPVEFEDKVDVELEALNSILESMIYEKAELSEAIAVAKKGIEIIVDKEKNRSLDAAIEYAKLLRRVAEGYYRSFTSKSDSKKKEMRKGYAFNVEGNQTSYFYEVEIVTSLKYKKDDFVKKEKELRMKADKISDEVERAMSSPLVDFEPKFNYLDSLDDIIASYKS